VAVDGDVERIVDFEPADQFVGKRQIGTRIRDE
jgi:hypothetical protein